MQEPGKNRTIRFSIEIEVLDLKRISFIALGLFFFFIALGKLGRGVAVMTGGFSGIFLLL